MRGELCTVDGCEKPQDSRGWCPMHYQRWKSHGDPHTTKRRTGRSIAPCSVRECVKTAKARTYCDSHLWRFYKYGDPLGKSQRAKPTTDERFWQKVDRGEPDECWKWTAAHMPQGYGTFAISNTADTSTFIGAHRYAYQALVGPIPDGLTLDHLCRNPACVNPAHLEPVTREENNRRAAAWKAGQNG